MRTTTTRPAGFATVGLAATTATAGRTRPLRFRIVGADGATVKGFDVDHPKIDGPRAALDAGDPRAGEDAALDWELAFLHVHPDEGSPRFMATFPGAGTYRLFLQFESAGRRHNVAFTWEVGS